MPFDAPSTVEDVFLEAARALSSARPEHMYEDLVRAAVKLVGADIGLIGRYIDIDGTPYIRSLAWLVQGKLLPNEDYVLAGTPCETVVGSTFKIYENRVGELFPTTDALRYGINGYAAYPLQNAQGEMLGILSVMTYEPLENSRLCESVLRVFAERISHEILRADTEQELRDREDYYRTLFDNALDALVVMDSKGVVLDYNARLSELDDAPREELIGKPPPTFQSPERYKEHIDTIRRVLAGEKISAEYQASCADGTIRNVEARSVRVDYAGEPRVLRVIRDVGEKRAREKALRESERRYRAVFDSSLDGLVVLNREGKVIDVNRALTEIDGFSRQELVGEYPPGFRQGELLEKHLEWAKRVIAGENIRHEGKLPRKDGTYYFAEMSATALDYEGEPRILTVVRDVTDRVLKETALDRSRARLEATIESALDCIISINESSEIIGFNPAAEETFGHRAADVIGSPMEEVIIPARLRAEHRNGMERYLQTGEQRMMGKRVEVIAQRADGSEFPAELTISVSEEISGKVFTGYLRDITDAKAAADERIMLEAQLRQAQKMEAIGHLTGGVAHDFNNILTGVLGYVEMARDRLDPDHDIKLEKYLTRAQRSGEKARDLIQQMLTFSRGDAGQPRSVSLAPIVEDSVTLLESTVPSSIAITTELPTDLPTVMLDPVHVEQILVNLCINARDAMENTGKLKIGLRAVDGGGFVCSSCSSNLAGSYVELSVSDTGPGIEPALVSRIFEPFFSTKETGKGSGMGLATVHGIIHEHGGHIIVDSSTGNGTVMRVLFRAEETISKDTSIPKVTRQAAKGAQLEGSVLVVDDNVQVAEFLEELLGDWGLKTTVFNDAGAALEHYLAQPNSYSLVVTDQTMPEVTGIQLAESLLEQDPALPIILYTGYSDVVNADLIEKTGIRALVQKPLDIPAFRKTVEQCITP